MWQQQVIFFIENSFFLKNKNLKIGFETINERIQCLYYGIEALPIGNRAICKRLFEFLALVAKNSDKNKMTGSIFE